MDSGSTETRRLDQPPLRPIDAGRFAPGTLFADRYRIVAPLGRGGMGEVYRADDQRLGQTVALKFLPATLENDPGARDRLIAEVRNARGVSHPNVVRVFDIGEAQGRFFLTMEYIDGEDLASLLRRIGRLPPAKALEIARQLCAGLAAAHERSVLHRDLKPANVMIDGRGHARIADFGLAVDRDAPDPLDTSGTIAYMAPERFQGLPATVQSDLYALGLVLYEAYTGKLAFNARTAREWQRAHTDSTPTNPSDLVSEIEPGVERAIMRCLEKDPAKRPASAAQVAASLPGGDPLAAALAAGETPSPQLVAASGEEGTLPRAQAWLWFGATLLALAAALPLASLWHLPNLVPSRDPVLLQEEARRILRDIGYTNAPYDSTWWFLTDSAAMQALVQRPPANRFAPASSPTRGPLVFCYRQSAAPLVDFQNAGGITANEPPPLRRDDAYVELQPGGGLRMLRVGGLLLELPRPPPGGVLPWPQLFSAAGLDMTRFSPTAPLWGPVFASDVQVAWEGSLDGQPLRVEAAAYRGRPTEFRVLPASIQPARPGMLSISTAPSILNLMMVLLLFASVGVLAGLARRNARMGRGDRKGARRIALVMFTAQAAVLLLNRHWISDPLFVFLIVFYCLGLAFTVAISVWLYYLGLEPYVRRRWPHLLVAWTRLLDGRWRDPLVGRGILAGTIAALCVCAIVPGIAAAVTRGLGWPLAVPWHHSQMGPMPGSLTTLLADRGTGLVAVFMAFFTLVIRLLAQLVVRDERAAWALVFITSAFVSYYGQLLIQPWVMATPVAAIVVATVLSAGAALVLAHHGLLACVVLGFIGPAFLNTPITDDMTRWYAPRTWILAALVVALAVWGLRNVLGRQAAFPGGVLDD